MGISLEDLKKRDYSKSFDELKAKAKELATEPEEELEILKNWIVHDLCCRKSTREGNSSANIDPPQEKIRKMKLIFTKPCSVSDIREDLVISNSENEEASSAAWNDHQMKRKRSPNAGSSSRNSEDRDECFNERKEPSSPCYLSARTKRKSQRTKDRHEFYYNNACEAGNMMNLMEAEKKKKKKATKPGALTFDGPPPELPMEFRNKIEALRGSEAKLVIQKKIYSTDISDHHDRLNMPNKQVLTMEVLNEQERAQLESGLEVRVIQPCLEEKTLYLRKWPSSPSYVFNSGWKAICAKPENNIKVGDIMQVWSFRVDDRGEVWFALVVIEQQAFADHYTDIIPVQP